MRGILAAIFLLAPALPPVASGQGPVPPGRAGEEAPGAILRGHAAGVTSLAFSPDGRRVVSASPVDVKTWDARTGREVGAREYPAGQAVALFPGGDRLAIATRSNKVMDGRLTILGLADGEPLLDVDPHGEWDRSFPFSPAIGAMAASPDGTRLAIGGSVARVGGSHGYPGGFAAIRDAKTGAILRRFELASYVGAVAFSPDGKALAAGTVGAGGELPISGEVRVWDIETGRQAHSFATRPDVEPGRSEGRVASVAFSPDGGRVAGSPSEVLVWDLATDRVALAVRPGFRRVGTIAFSPDGRWLASGGPGDPVVRLWSTATGRQVEALSTGFAGASALAFSPDGLRLAVGGASRDKSGVVRLWPVPGDAARPPAEAAPAR